MATVKCEFPYAGPTCEETYAEHLGATFDNFTYGFAAFLVVLGLLTFFFTGLVFKRKGFTKQLDTQKSMWLLSCAMTVTCAIRAPDLEGFKMVMPYVVFLLAADIGSALLYSLVFTLLHDWVNVVMYVSGRARYEKAVNNLFYFLNGLIWLSYIPLSVLQAEHHDTWLWRAIKFVISAIALLIIVIVQSVFGYFIFNTLAKNERRGVTPVHVRQNSARNTTEVSKIPEREDSYSENNDSVSVPGPSRLGAAAVDVSDPSTTTSPPRGHHKQSSISSMGTPNIPQNIQNRSNLRKQKSRVHRIKWLLVIYGVCETGVLIAQLNTAFTLYKDKDTKTSLVTPPDGLFDLVYATVFDWIHLVAMFMLIVFFRPRFKKEHKEPTPPPKAPQTIAQRKKSQASLFAASKTPSRHQLQVELVIRDEPRDNEAVLAALSANRGSITQSPNLAPTDFARTSSLHSLSTDGTEALLSPPAAPTQSPSASSSHSNLLSPLIIPQPSSSSSLLTPQSTNSDQDDQNIPAFALSQPAGGHPRYAHHTFSHSQSQSVHISTNQEAGNNADSQPHRRPSFPISFSRPDKFEPLIESPRPTPAPAATAKPLSGPVVSADPDDWERFETEQGVPYYYSERRRSSQWERPSSPQSPQQ